MSVPSRPIADRFWPKVAKAPPDKCWEWTASTKGNGYGAFQWLDSQGRRRQYAHRAAWFIAHGDIPDGLYVCHRCDNRRCVNPDHLWLGTHQQNQADMGRKGRTFSPAKKLSDEQVAEIRSRASDTRKALAEEYGVLPSHISRIRLGRRRGVT